MLPGQLMWDWFTVVDNMGHSLDAYAEFEVECENCGSCFVIDTQTERNMIYKSGEWVPECPECGQTGNPRDSPEC